ncbi:MAG: ribonuclease III [Gammaproteobacteria bacterium]|nr:ribonuclease III [Gammaproteobacteria bacterium]
MLEKFQSRLGYSFKDRYLLVLALTHRSKGHRNNERLEYLGDSILGFIIAGKLYHQFPKLGEGDLTKMRSRLVRGKTLTALARKLDIGAVMLLGAGELKSGGADRDSILADAFEALIGAIYLDSNLDVTSGCVLKLYENLLDSISPESLKDNKTQLQEMLQKANTDLPIYDVIEQLGSQHNPVFKVSCVVPGTELAFIADGSSRRIAEQAAAELAIDGLELLAKSNRQTNRK